MIYSKEKIHRIRLNNLIILTEKYGKTSSGKINVAKFSRLINKDPTQIRAYLRAGNKGGRFMGEMLAREIEESIGLHSNWMDKDHNECKDKKINIYKATNFKVKTLTFTLWSNLVNFINSNNKNMELRMIIIDESKIKKPITNKAFITEINDNIFQPPYIKGTQLLVDPDIKPVRKDVILIRLPGDHITLVRYRTGIGNSIYFENYELGLPESTTIKPDDKYEIIGVVIWIAYRGETP